MKEPKKSTSEARLLSASAIHWAKTAFSKTTLTQAHFAELLSESDEQGVFFKRITRYMPADEGQKAIACNLKKVQRYLNYETPIPADILVAWADALPSPYCDYLRNELADTICPRHDIGENIAACIKELSEGITALAEGDKTKIRKELTEAKAAIETFLGVMA